MRGVLWLGIMCVWMGLGSAMAGPEESMESRLFPGVKAADVCRISISGPDGGHDFQRDSLADPWHAQRVVWAPHMSFGSQLKLNPSPVECDQSAVNRLLMKVLVMESSSIHAQGISPELVWKAVFVGPQIALTDANGEILARCIVGSEENNLVSTYIIVLPPDGSDGTMYEVEGVRRSEFDGAQCVVHSESPQPLDPPKAKTGRPANRLDSTRHEDPWTACEDAIATVTKSGLKIAIMKRGEGREIEAADDAKVHYTGWLENGTPIDSSVDPEFGHTDPLWLFAPWGVIEGWKEGLVGMQVGEVRKLWIPSQLAYRQLETPHGEVPPNSNLIFEIELLEIITAE